MCAWTRRAFPAANLPETGAQDLLARRLRQMYQVGLLGFIREQNPQASLKLMGRALGRLDSLYAIDPRARLCWIGAAAVEAVLDGQLLPRKARKQLFSRIDRELKQLLANSSTRRPAACRKSCSTSWPWPIPRDPVRASCAPSSA